MSHIKLDNNKCKSCYLCIDACPRGLIKKSEEIGKTGEYIVKFEDNEKQCLGCRHCALVCPEITITEVHRDE